MTALLSKTRPSYTCEEQCTALACTCVHPFLSWGMYSLCRNGSARSWCAHSLTWPVAAAALLYCRCASCMASVLQHTQDLWSRSWLPALTKALDCARLMLKCYSKPAPHPPSGSWFAVSELWSSDDPNMPYIKKMALWKRICVRNLQWEECTVACTLHWNICL